MNNYRLAAALRYFICARHSKGHGIHSPFVFDFINTVLLKKIPGDKTKVIKHIREKMESSKMTVEVNDLGAGSTFMSTRHRRLSDLSRQSSVHNRYGRILFNLASLYDGRNILEMGTSVGISTLFMSLGAPSSKIISIEGCANLAEIARNNFSDAEAGNIEIMRGEFDEQLTIIRKREFSPSMVYVDGNHRKEAVLKYFASLKELIAQDSVIIFDDINYSNEMNEAWNEIKSDLQVSLSIDIFQMGLVFFPEGMTKQDFVLRY